MQALARRTSTPHCHPERSEGPAPRPVILSAAKDPPALLVILSVAKDPVFSSWLCGKAFTAKGRSREEKPTPSSCAALKTTKLMVFVGVARKDRSHPLCRLSILKNRLCAMGLNDDLPDHFRDHLPNGAAWHLNAQHGRQRRGNVCHVGFAVGLSRTDAPAHEHERDMRIIRIP